MATVKGMLGQAAPAATTETDLYTVPAAKNATVKVVCTNRASGTPVRVSVGVNGAATEDKQYVAYDEVLNANETVSTVAIMIGSTDVVRVYAGSANVSFSCTGIEEDD